MSGPVDARLQRVLGGEHLASLRKRLRRRFERAPLDRVVEQIRIDGLAAEEHAALASLLGRRQRYTASLQIDLGRVDDTLRRSGIAGSLREALEQLDGPITHLAATRLRLESLWLDVIDGCRHPDLIGLLRTPEGIGLLKRLARHDAAAARYHGDFDWPGLHIGNHVMREYGAASWRFDATDYVAAVRTAPSLTHLLHGRAVEASWDKALAAAMRGHGVAIAEEAVAAALLPDLADR